MGRHARYTDAEVVSAVARSTSVAGVLRILGVKPAGGSHANLSRRIKRMGLDTSHFTGKAHNRGKRSTARLHWTEILVVRPAGSARAKPAQLRRALVEAGVVYRCAGCGIGSQWNGKPLTLHVEHRNGDYLDCRPTNLEFLCPNCHTQTATWAGRNRWLRPPDDSVA